MTARFLTSNPTARNSAIGAGIGLGVSGIYNGAVVLKEAQKLKTENTSYKDAFNSSASKLKNGDIGMSNFIKTHSANFSGKLKEITTNVANSLKGIKGVAIYTVALSAIGAGIGAMIGLAQKNNQTSEKQ